MRKALFSIVTLCAACRLAAAEEPDFKQLCAALSAAPRTHPYLIFDEAGKAAMLKRIAADRTEREVLEKIRLEGRRLMQATVQRAAPPREPHSRYVGSDPYNTYLLDHAKSALTLAFLYQVTGDPSYAAKAFEYVEPVCALDSWVQSPHRFEVIYPRVWPYGAQDDEVVFSYDITTAGVTRDLSYIYDWLYPALPKAHRDRIRGALLEKAITRVRGDYDYFWWATAYKCNWSGICHSGLGLAALTLLDEDPKLTDVVARSCEGVWNMLGHIGEDGGWQEGRGYWAYGVGESVMFMDAVKRATGGRVDLFKHPGVYPHPADFALYGMTAAFGDGTGQAVGESFIINKLAQESGDPRAAWYSQRFVRPLDGVFDLIWPKASVTPQAPADSSRWFKSIDWAVLRRDFSRDAMTLACKAGMNDDPHHGHMDCGSFTLTWRGLPFIGEVPRNGYDEQYFSAGRWDHLEASTEAHNVVLVNGEEQVCAKLKDQPWKTGIGGKITEYASESDWGYVEMDPTHAYPGTDLKSWRRWIALDKSHSVVIIVDRVGCSVGSEIEVRFHPGVELEVGGNQAVLHGVSTEGAPRERGARAGGARRPYSPEGEHEGGPVRARADDLVMIPLATGTPTVIQGRQPDLPVTEQPAFSWIPYFSTTLKAPAESTVIVSVFCPGSARDGAQCRLESVGGVPAVSLTIDGQRVRYLFGEDRVERSAVASGQR